MLRTLRQADAADAADKAVELLNRGFSPRNIWDGILTGAGELLMRKPGIVALHSVTTANALHYAWEHTADDQTRQWLLLQGASFLTLSGKRKVTVRLYRTPDISIIPTRSSPMSGCTFRSRRPAH